MAASITLLEIPESVYCFIIQKQADIKMQKKKGQYSLSQAVIQIIKEQMANSGAASVCK
jgi:hypothetical protein